MIYKYVGLYSDIYNCAMHNFNETVIETDLSELFLSDAWNRPSQWFMATEPRRPMIYIVMDQIISNVLNMKQIFKPPVVFVTARMAVNNAYDLFHYEEALEDKMHIFEVGIHTSMHGKKTKNIGKIVSRSFIRLKYNYADIVSFNAIWKVG